MNKKVACSASAAYNGCWAEYMLTSASLCVPISKNISLDQAAMMFVNPMTALAFFDVYNQIPNPSKKLRGIINTAGASALGRMIIKLGKRKGIPIISIVRRKEQVEMLKNEGAEFVVNSESPEFSDELKELAHRLNAIVLFDAVCGKLSQKLLDAAPNGSKLFIYGRLSPDACEINPGDLIFNGKEIQGFWLSHWLKNKNLIQIIKNTRKIQSLLNNELATNIYKKFKPEEITQAIKTYESNMSAGKILIQF